MMSRYVARVFTVATCPKCERDIGQVIIGMECYCRLCKHWFMAKEKRRKEEQLRLAL